MVSTKVEFVINTRGPVTQNEIAEALFRLFQTSPFAYEKPPVIRTTQESGSERHHSVLSSLVEGEVISV